MTEMAKFLIFSPQGWFWNLAQRLEDEGHEAVLYISTPEFKHVADGLVTKVEDYNEILKDDRRREWILVADNIGLGATLDKLKAEGWGVFGGSKFADNCERNRAFGTKVLLASGIPTPETWVFTTPREAIDFLRETKMHVVLKPHNNKVYTYVAQDYQDAIQQLTYWDEMGLLKGTPLEVQRFIKGWTVSTEVWFAHGIPVFPPNHTIETKRFLVDDLGVMTGCMTSVVWAGKAIKRLAREVTLRMQPILQKQDWTGVWDINAIVSERSHRFFALEHTPRIGYNAIFCSWLLMDDFGEVIEQMVKDPQRAVERGLPYRTDQFAVAAEVTVPPYPFEHPDKTIVTQVFKDTLEGKPLFLDFNETYPAYLFPCDVFYDERYGLVMAGTNGIIYEVVASDADPKAAWQRVVDTVKQLRLPNKQARLRDGIETFLQAYPRLVEWNLTPAISPSETHFPVVPAVEEAG